ncbi:hypothetical protein [Almyronema epifaneia]|uniref:Uncharacterized protein n=1 Tax=Almyronema epifaneia S1 TaxID=2991925 RepID=A0ABW6IK23_9CYAN
MRVNIEKGYHSLIYELMEKLKTDDPKLAVHHIIGCWAMNQGCPGTQTASKVEPPESADEFSNLVDWS